MSIELEMKILNIDVEKEHEKILKKGGIFKEEVFQKLYTYDLFSIYGRFRDAIMHLNSKKIVEIEVNYEKLKNLFWEIDSSDLYVNRISIEGEKFENLQEILFLPNWMDVVQSEEVNSYLKEIDINPKKWIRLRETNGRTTLAVKHILNNKDNLVQNMMETEIEVRSFEETDKLLQQLGFVHKSYQEKRRMIFELNQYEIDFDFWPGIPPFMEFEGKTVEDLIKILELLEYSMEEAVSCTADEIYIMYGKNMLKDRVLTF